MTHSLCILKRWFLLLFIVFAVLKTSAQLEPRVFADISGYRNLGFKENFYASAAIGAELFKFKFIAPEVSIAYLSGSLEDDETIDPENPSVNLNFTSTGIDGVVYSIAPKLISSFDDGSAFLIPSFSLTHAEAYATYYENDGIDRFYLNREHVSTNGTYYYWSAALGAELYLPNSDSWSMAVYLIYTANPSGKLFDELEFKEYDAYIPSEKLETLGFGFRVYFDPFKKR